MLIYQRVFFWGGTNQTYHKIADEWSRNLCRFGVSHILLTTSTPKKAEKCFQHAFDDGLPTFSRCPTFLSTFGCKKATPAPWEDLSWAQVILAWRSPTTWDAAEIQRWALFHPMNPGLSYCTINAILYRYDLHISKCKFHLCTWYYITYHIYIILI